VATSRCCPSASSQAIPSSGLTQLASIHAKPTKYPGCGANRFGTKDGKAFLTFLEAIKAFFQLLEKPFDLE